MPIYWMFLFTPIVIYLINSQLRKRVRITIDGSDKKNNEAALVFISFAVIVFFAGMRSRVGDTTAYVNGFKSLPDISNYSLDINGKDWLFGYLSCLFKSIISTSYQPWLFFIALICGIAVGRAIYKYSEYKCLSCYLFVASALFVYFINGMRQFIPMSILFCKIDWVLDKKYVRFIGLTALLAQIHATAWIFLLLIPLCRFKPWGFAILAVIIASCAFGMLIEDSFVEVFDTVFENTQYAGIGTRMEEIGNGMSFMRVLVSAVPVGMSLIFRKKIIAENNPLIDLCINGSIMCTAIYIVAMFTSGIHIGRLAAYFNMFNVILLPWLVMKMFDKKSRDLICALMIFLYGVYFYYQMNVAWGGLKYVSESLGISFQ